MKTLSALGVAIGLAATAGSAAPSLSLADNDTAAANTCFRLSQIRGQRADGDKALYLRTRPDKVFRLEMKNGCPTMGMNTDGLIMTPAGGADLVCSPLSLDLKVRNGSFATPCLIDKITRLSQAEAAALPKKIRP